MRVTPHILLKKGDIIKMPQGGVDYYVEVVGLIEGYLWVERNTNRFTLPWGFYLKCKDCFIPIC